MLEIKSRAGYYPPLEEKWNIYSHGFGLFLSIIGFILLLLRAIEFGEITHLLSFSIFGASLILLYAASTFYHSAKSPLIRYRLNILDHAAIYVLIAGTYTPYALVTLTGTVGWSILGVVWTLAIIGVVLKLFYTGRYSIISTAMYVIMGWIIIFAIKPLYANLDMWGITWLLIGGLSYTLGAVFFMLKKFSFNHAIFHMFVLLGSFSHFISIYYYVVPTIPKLPL